MPYNFADVIVGALQQSQDRGLRREAQQSLATYRLQELAQRLAEMRERGRQFDVGQENMMEEGLRTRVATARENRLGREFEGEQNAEALAVQRRGQDYTRETALGMVGAQNRMADAQVLNARTSAENANFQRLMTIGGLLSGLQRQEGERAYAEEVTRPGGLADMSAPVTERRGDFMSAIDDGSWWVGSLFNSVDEDATKEAGIHALTGLEARFRDLNRMTPQERSRFLAGVGPRINSLKEAASSVRPSERRAFNRRITRLENMATMLGPASGATGSALGLGTQGQAQANELLLNIFGNGQETGLTEQSLMDLLQRNQ